MREQKGVLRDNGKSPQARERLRRHYRPERVRILFVGEAPPASGRFFYQADSGLYRAVKNAFVAAFPKLSALNFLNSFRSLGCYLVDLCGQPVDRMKQNARRRICRAGETQLSRRLIRLRPAMVIIVVRSIGSNVKRAEMLAKWSGRHIELPYPGKWHHSRVEFREKLVPLLRTVLSKAVK